MEKRNKIYSIIHEVSYKNPLGDEFVRGALIYANDDGNYYLFFREYSQRIFNPQFQNEICEVEIKFSNLTKIQFKLEENEYKLFFTIKDSKDVFEFHLQKNLYCQIVQLLQTIAIKQSKNILPLKRINAFITTSYNGMAAATSELILHVKNGEVLFPEPYKFKDEIIPDFHTAKRYNVNGNIFINNPITQNDFSNFENLESLKKAVKNRGISDNIRYILWPVILRVLPFENSTLNAFTENQRMILKSRTEEYLSIKKQWKSLSKYQIKDNRPLSSCFATIRVDVHRTHPVKKISSIPCWNTMLIDILFSFSTWSPNIRYTQGLNDIVLIILSVFLPPATEQKITFDEAEALSFWCFASFIESIRSSIIAKNIMESQVYSLKIVQQIISSTDKKFDEWLRMKKLTDLSFVISSHILIFSRSFELNHIFRIWESIICSPSPPIFFNFLTASLLIHNFNSSPSIVDMSNGEIISSIDYRLSKQHIGNIIGVAYALQKQFVDQKLPEEIKENVNDLQNPFFNLDTKSAKEYCEFNLFV